MYIFSDQCSFYAVIAAQNGHRCKYVYMYIFSDAHFTRLSSYKSDAQPCHGRKYSRRVRYGYVKINGYNDTKRYLYTSELQSSMKNASHIYLATHVLHDYCRVKATSTLNIYTKTESYIFSDLRFTRLYWCKNAIYIYRSYKK